MLDRSRTEMGTTQQTLQQDLQNLKSGRTWDMHSNPSKCQVLYITRARNPLQSLYVLHAQVLEAVDHAKYMGLEIGHDLNWNQHIQNVTTKDRQFRPCNSAEILDV